jgi:hypothetical protein
MDFVTSTLFTLNNMNLLVEIKDIIKHNIFGYLGNEWMIELRRSIEKSNSALFDIWLWEALCCVKKPIVVNIVDSLLRANNKTLLDLTIGNGDHVLHHIVFNTSIKMRAKQMIDSIALIAGPQCMQKLVLKTNNLQQNVLMYVVTQNQQCGGVAEDTCKMYVEEFIKYAGDLSDELLNASDKPGKNALDWAEAKNDQFMMDLLRPLME